MPLFVSKGGGGCIYIFTCIFLICFRKDAQGTVSGSLRWRGNPVLGVGVGERLPLCFHAFEFEQKY